MTNNSIRQDYCSIYLITNTLDSKKYVGQTWYPLQRRFKGHACKNNRGCPYLYRAITKHGLPAFTIELLTTCTTQETADLAEQQYIQQYETTNKEKGYNLSKGGQYGKGEMPEEVRQRISEKLTGIKRSEETKQKMSENITKSMTNLSQESETNLNTSRAKKRKLTMEQANQIRQRNANGERQIDLAKEFGISLCGISFIINNKTYINNY